MKKEKMTSMERVLTSLSHQEPDRVPLFLLLTMHGAKELGLSIEEYFSKAENVIEGQLRLQKKYSNDCFYPFFHAPIEIEAFGGEVVYRDDGPPNAGKPIINSFEEINKLEPHKVSDAKVLHKVLDAISGIKEHAKGNIPIIGVVMSPFSLPVMQLGFEKYFQLMHDHKEIFRKLMEINTAFCIDYANAQLKAGATAICYFDPIASPTMIPREFYRETGFEIAKSTIAKIEGPTATHLASGHSLPISDLLSTTGTAVIGVSSKESLTDLKKAFYKKLTILGNLNGIEMRRWTPEETKSIVKGAIQSAAEGGGFILSDNHGEIPFQVPDDVLMNISEAVQEFGSYPINKSL
jgi:uroporphyrinogen decarboxylase